MANQRKLTPEEKLLHVIEKPGDIKKMDLKKRGNASKLGIPPAILKSLDPGKMTLQGVNKFLISIGALATIILVFLFVKSERFMQTRFEDLKENIGKRGFELAKDEGNIPDHSTYIARTGQNNPFHVLPDIQKMMAEEAKKQVKLKLVGIIWSDTPQAILEDENTKKNYLVYEGDTVDKYEISEINQNEVKILADEGEVVLR